MSNVTPKIKELAEQAGIDAFFHKGLKLAQALDKQEPLPEFNDQEVLLEKFAKLIIDECCNRMEYRDDSRIVPRPTWQLYEHFGLDWKNDWYTDDYGVWKKK